MYIIGHLSWSLLQGIQSTSTLWMQLQLRKREGLVFNCHNCKIIKLILLNVVIVEKISHLHHLLWNRVCTGPWKPGKSWNLKIWISDLESYGIFVEVLESLGIWTYRSIFLIISILEFSCCTSEIWVYLCALKVCEFIEKVLEFDIRRSWNLRYQNMYEPCGNRKLQTMFIYIALLQPHLLLHNSTGKPVLSAHTWFLPPPPYLTELLWEVSNTQTVIIVIRLVVN